jgi:hypothetical protein
MTNITVNQRSPEVEAMACHWPIIDALMGGTAAMRAAREKYLPHQPREDKEDYEYRLKTATLFPAFPRTVGVMAGKPFSKQATMSDGTPDRIRQLAENIDGEGRSLHVFAADLMQEAVSAGFGGILVDFTRTDGQARTQADEKQMGARPYWVHIKHEQILGWRTHKVAGITTLSQLRIAERAEVEDGEFGVKCVNRVRVLEPGLWRLYEEATAGYTLVEQGATTLQVIPFVPIYGRRLGFMRGHPPLLDLANLNVKHWQHQSTQDNSADFARRRLLVFIGLDEANDLTASSSQAIKLPVGGDAKIIQGSAESVTVGRAELDALEDQMIQTGAELLTKEPGDRSATEAANDAEANKSELQRIVETFEDSLDLALQYTAMWLGMPEGGNVTLYKDFLTMSMSEASAQMVLAMQQAGLITKKTAIREEQRRGVVSADIDPEEELEAVAQEGPALGSLEEGQGAE